MRRFLNSFEQCLNRLVGIFHFLGFCLVLPSLLLITLADIALRAGFNAPLSWGNEVLGLLLISLLFLVLPHNVQRLDFFHIDTLYRNFDTPTRTILMRLVWLNIAGVGILIVWQAMIAAWEMYEFREEAYTIPIPYWPFSVLIAVSGLLTSIQALLRVATPVKEKHEC